MSALEAGTPISVSTLIIYRDCLGSFITAAENVAVYLKLPSSTKHLISIPCLLSSISTASTSPFLIRSNKDFTIN